MPEDRNKMSGGQLSTADDLPQPQEEKEVLDKGGGEPGCHGEDWNGRGDWQHQDLGPGGLQGGRVGERN